ncbi:MAG TPA: ATPase, T2SS/T4P/T4SS family [Planctomycetota bacterium]|nr:ATPase, T2SS/T4P/T4SS family [Planctomycetota bacterium]
MTLEDRLRRTLALPDDQAPYGQALRLLLEDASSAGVSDVHLNPTPGGLEVLYRRDGVLLPQGLIDSARAERVIGKVKVLAGLLTYRHDVPQDGQIPAAQAGGRSDVRVSLFPTVHGEKAVLRFFLHDSDQFDLDRLGYAPAVATRLRAAAARPDGVILLTGPSGSGKTTAIYSLLREIAQPSGGIRRNVVTIEDPVEHAIPGITQSQVNPPAGLTFAAALRSLLRQDPQVILVGEIRDRETAHVAMEAGLTGHLVISTIHSGTAAGVAVRVLEMGIEPHVLTASLSCILAQRLSRRLDRPGRQVIAELLEMDDGLRRVIAGNPTRTDLEEAAVRGGMIPLREDAARLIREGRIAPEEAARVLG